MLLDSPVEHSRQLSQISCFYKTQQTQQTRNKQASWGFHLVRVERWDHVVASHNETPASSPSLSLSTDINIHFLKLFSRILSRLNVKTLFSEYLNKRNPGNPFNVSLENKTIHVSYREFNWEPHEVYLEQQIWNFPGENILLFLYSPHYIPTSYARRAGGSQSSPQGNWEDSAVEISPACLLPFSSSWRGVRITPSSGLPPPSSLLVALLPCDHVTPLAPSDAFLRQY